jgi:hypothetical protein
MDRTPQYKPLTDLLGQMQIAQQASDDAAAAVAANAAETVTAQQKYNALAQKMAPWGGATPADAIAYGDAWNALNALQAAEPGLMTDAQNKITAFRTMWQTGLGLYQNILQTPGAVEQPGNTGAPITT